MACPRCLRPRNFFPALVSPRSSRCLCTGSTIQLMRGSCPRQINLGETLSYGQLFTQRVHFMNSCICSYPPSVHLIQSATELPIGSTCKVSWVEAVHLTDGRMRNVDQDNLKVLVGRVLQPRGAAHTSECIRRMQPSCELTYIQTRLMSYRGSVHRCKAVLQHSLHVSLRTSSLLKICEGAATWQCTRTSLTQYELSTRRPPSLRPARSSATLRRFRVGFSCVMPWFTGLPYTMPCAAPPAVSTDASNRFPSLLSCVL